MCLVSKCMLPKWHGILKRFLYKNKFIISHPDKLHLPVFSPFWSLMVQFMRDILNNCAFTATTLPSPLLSPPEPQPPFGHFIQISSTVATWVKAQLPIPCKWPPYLHDRLPPSMLSSPMGCHPTIEILPCDLAASIPLCTTWWNGTFFRGLDIRARATPCHSPTRASCFIQEEVVVVPSLSQSFFHWWLGRWYSQVWHIL